MLAKQFVDLYSLDNFDLSRVIYLVGIFFKYEVTSICIYEENFENEKPWVNMWFRDNSQVIYNGRQWKYSQHSPIKEWGVVG